MGFMNQSRRAEFLSQFGPGLVQILFEDSVKKYGLVA